MLRKAFATITALSFLLQTILPAMRAEAQSVPDSRFEQTHPALASSLTHTLIALDAQNRRASFAGLNVFLRDDYHGPFPVLVQADCFGPPATPPLAIDAATYGANARLLNLTRQPEHGCGSYQIASVSEPMKVGAITTTKDTGIAVSVHYSGLPKADGQLGNPGVFVFNPVHGNWTEAKSFVPSVQEPQRVYATLAEQHQRIIGGVIAAPESLQSEPARSSPSSLAKPLEQISPVDGYLAVDRIEPDNKGAYGVNLPLLLRPSRGPGPSFAIRYNSQGAPGVLGRGWDLFISSIEVRGPAPIYHPEYETEDYVLDGTDLIPLDANGKEMPSLYKGGPIIRRITGARLFRLRNNSAGLIIRRYGDSPSNYYWEIWDPNSHITKLYGGEFDGEKKPPRRSEPGNGVLRGVVKLGDGVQRDVIGQWSLTQEYDRQRARVGSSYFYFQTDKPPGEEPKADKPRRECRDPQWNGADCKEALRLHYIEYNRVLSPSSAGATGISENGLTTVRFDWRARDWERINSDARLGVFRAQEYWLESIEVLYQPHANNAWLAGTAAPEGKPVLFAKHNFALTDKDRDKDKGAKEDEFSEPCMNYDVVLRSYTVTANDFYDRDVTPISARSEEEIPLKEQKFSFEYEGEKFKKDKDECSRDWADAPIDNRGNLPNGADAVSGQLGFPSGLLDELGFGLLTSQSLLGTARTKEVGGSLYVGVGPLGNTSSKELTGGAKVGANFTQSEGNSTLIDVTGDGVDDIVFRSGGELQYCAGVRNPTSHTIDYPAERCGAIRGISEFSASSTSTRSRAAEGYGAFSEFVGVGFSSSKSDSYVYFTDRDGDGLLDLVAYGRVFYGQGENREKREVWFAPKSGLTPPIPGIVSTDLVPGKVSNETSKKIDESRKKLTAQFPADMIKTVKEIEARLATVSQDLAALHYSQTTIAWEAPLAGIITIKGELKHGESTPEPENAMVLGHLDPKRFEALHGEVESYQKEYIKPRLNYSEERARFECRIWNEEYCYQIVADPVGPHHIDAQVRTFAFIQTPAARARVSLDKRSPPKTHDCTGGDKDFDDLAALTFNSDCRGAGTDKQIQVAVGDVLYITYSIHPHLAKWRKPTATVSYVAVANDAAFKLSQENDPNGRTDALPCKWLDGFVSGRKADDCLLTRQTRYTFDLRTGSLTSSSADTTELAAGSYRMFGGTLDVPAGLTDDYQVYFDVIAKRTPDVLPPPKTSYNIPASALERLFRQDISDQCRGVIGVCTVEISPQCDAAHVKECIEFLSYGAVRYKVAARIAVEHRLSGQALPVRNISARLHELKWRVPPHVSSIFTEKVEATNKDEPNRIHYKPDQSFDKSTLVYLPIAMGEPDLEHIRVTKGTFHNPDVDLNEDDRTPDTIDFSQILDSEWENVKLARSRQTIALCNFADDILKFLEDGHSIYGQPYSDEYVDYWKKKRAPHDGLCRSAREFFGKQRFTGGHAPEIDSTQILRLPYYLGGLPYAEQVTSAETLFERVLINLGLAGATGANFDLEDGKGDEFKFAAAALLTDHPRLTRRGYRLPMKANPFDCKTLFAGLPLRQPIMLPDETCTYRISANFAMQDLRDLGLDSAAIERVRGTLASFADSKNAAFKIQLTATVNGRPVGFRELSAAKTDAAGKVVNAGNEDCEPKVAARTCLGSYGTISPIKAYYYPSLEGAPPDERHGDAFPRVTTNKRTGRAVAFSNNIMRAAKPPLARCPRDHKAYATLGEMETKQDCVLDLSDMSESEKAKYITPAEKYVGPEIYAVDYDIRENNHVTGRNRVLEFDATPLDVIELNFRLAPVGNAVTRDGSSEEITGKFSIFDPSVDPPAHGVTPGRYIIPRSPKQILPDGDVDLNCPNLPVPPRTAQVLLPANCRLWTRLGWTEVFLGAQYRTYSDAQQVGKDDRNLFSIKRRRDFLRLHPEIEVEADQYILDGAPGNAPTVKGWHELERYAFYSRGPNVPKVGGNWALFGTKTSQTGDAPNRRGRLVELPSFSSLRHDPPRPLPVWNINGLYESLIGVCDARKDKDNPAKPPPDHNACEREFAKEFNKVNPPPAFDSVTHFTLGHRFVGPVNVEAAEKAKDKQYNPGMRATGVCAMESPNAFASCWKGADDTVFLERAIVTRPKPREPPPELHSVSALVGFERPPVVQFDYEFASYKKLACRDPEFPPALKARFWVAPLDPRLDIVEHCSGEDASPSKVAEFAHDHRLPGSSEGSAGGVGDHLSFPNRPTPPKANQTVEIFAPVQRSSSSSVSHNGGTALVNAHSIDTNSRQLGQFRDVNGDGFPDVISDGGVELTSPVGLSRREWWQYFRARSNEPAADFSPDASNFDQETHATSSGVGIGLSASTAIKFLPKATRSNTTGSSDPQVDPSFDLSLEKGQDEEFMELRDFNGDGLADKLTGSMVGAGLSLQFNTGSSLRGDSKSPLKAADAQVSGFHFNTSHSSGFGVRLGFSWGAGSYAAGMGLAHRDNGSQAALMDFNGDGRPDIVLPHPKQADSLMVFPNLGNGFGKSRVHRLKNWAFTPQAGLRSRTALSETTLVDAGLIYTYGVNLKFVRIVFSPDVKWSQNQTRELLSIRDLNGDGVPDLVAVAGDFLPSNGPGSVTLLSSSLKTHAYYNPEGKYHLLTAVTNPSGTKWVLRHDLYGNSGPEHGRAVWALTGVARYDGFDPPSRSKLAADGQDVLLTTYDYSSGYFNRAEKQFYGFANRTSTTYGCDFTKEDGNLRDCLAVVSTPGKLDWAALNAGGYRKLQAVTQAFSNQDYLTQGVELSRAVAGVDSGPPRMTATRYRPGGRSARDKAISRNNSRYLIDNLASLTTDAPDTCYASHANASEVSWDVNTFTSGGSSLSSTWDGTTFSLQRKVFGPAVPAQPPAQPVAEEPGICGTDVGQCPQTLAKAMCDKGFVREQRSFWAQQSGSVRLRLSALETFGGGVPANRFSNSASPPVDRLRSVVTFDHDQWGQVLRFNSIGEANSTWAPSAPSSANAKIDYTPRQARNAGGGSGYPILGLAERIQIFGGPWRDPDSPAAPLRAREALYSTASGNSDTAPGNLTDICLYPGGPGFTFTPGMCSTFKEHMHAALNDGYSTMQTALRLAYDKTGGLPKGQSTFNAIVHHKILDYDEFGNVKHTISPLSQNKEWIERRFKFDDDPFRRTATITEWTRCVNDIPGAGIDSPDFAKLADAGKPRCTYGLGATLPEPIQRKPITHISRARIDTHFGAVAQTRDINANSLLYDFDRWGRLSLVARSWGNAPRENRTFQGRLKRAVAKDETRRTEDENKKPINQSPSEMLEVKDWRLLALVDYEKISDDQLRTSSQSNNLLRSNLRRFESSDSYAGLLSKDHTTRESAIFSDGLGRPIQSIREADVCLGALPDLIEGKNTDVTATLSERCEETATGIVTPSTRIDALGRDLASFESYPIDPRKRRTASERRFTMLVDASSKPEFLSKTTYDGAGRPLLVESRLSEPKPATVLGSAQYAYSIVPEEGARLSRFEMLSLSPRCTASAIWSDARGLRRAVFEDQANFFSGAVPPPAGPATGRDHEKTRGYCAPIGAIANRWSADAKASELSADAQPARVSYTYDPLQQLTEVDYPLAGANRAAITARFDLLGRTLEVQEPNSGCTRYAYDGLNLLMSEAGFRHEGHTGKPCGTSSRVRNEKSYDYSGGRLVRMSYHSLEEQGGAPDERDTVRLHYDRYPYAALFGEVLETLRFVPNDQANQRFVDVTGRKCDNCIGQVTVVSDRSGARGFSYNELGLTRREVRSFVAPLRDVKHSRGTSETYVPEVAFHEVENSYTAFGDPVQEKFAESAPMNPANACVAAGVETCLTRFTTGHKYAADGAVAQLLFNGKPLIHAAQDQLGRPAVRWTSNGIATGYAYDPLDLRLNQMTTVTAANVHVQINDYQYDGGGNILGYGNKAQSDQGYGTDFSFEYDPVNRLRKFDAEVSRGWSPSIRGLSSRGEYSYDAGHRFTSRRLSILGHSFAGESGTAFERKWAYVYGDDPANGPLHAPNTVKFTNNNSVRDHVFDYDDIGRMTRVGTRTDEKSSVPVLSNRAMTWDAEGRVIRVRGTKDASTENNDKLLREDYVYDSGGNRALKIYRPLWWDEKEPVEKERLKEREYATVYMTPSYARPYDKRGAVQLSQGSLPAASLSAPADQSEDPVVTYLYSDLPVGSMTAAVTKYGEATDARATVIARREYSPYGLELTSDSLADTKREGAAPLSVFHGKELDRVTEFSSFGARPYSRDLGVWLIPDPMMSKFLTGAPGRGVFEPKNLSAFSYIGNDPLNRTDPTGQFILQFAGAGCSLTITFGCAPGAIVGAIVGIAATAGCAVHSGCRGAVASIPTKIGNIYNENTKGKDSDTVPVKDLVPTHQPSDDVRSRELGKLSDEELLEAVTNPKEKNPILIKTDTGKVHEGNRRAWELKKRAADPTSSITPETRVPVGRHDPENDKFFPEPKVRPKGGSE
ncbi:RHS repeat-associated core domain-containing protein [Bradyrhizobium japonicum]|uniref:RHS repeat-associated core domain-containing protein n=1 Tax=Bradyrhizobium japonicum TaxID=375 RepID=UPI0004B2F29A|nr:RHS repeat-associated core domain-containing protein [Bradyrhizobium japonicum]